MLEYKNSKTNKQANKRIIRIKYKNIRRRYKQSNRKS